MTDRELLDLAARALLAAGMEKFHHIDYSGWAVFDDEGYARNWNPLKDDGDALRLAATLCFSVIQYKHSVEIIIGDDLIHRELSDGTMTRIELTRRAITRAAAQIQLDKEKQ